MTEREDASIDQSGRRLSDVYLVGSEATNNGVPDGCEFVGKLQDYKHLLSDCIGSVSPDTEGLARLVAQLRATANEIEEDLT